MKLNADQRKDRQEHLDGIAEALYNLNRAVEDYNGLVAEAEAEVDTWAHNACADDEVRKSLAIRLRSAANALCDAGLAYNSAIDDAAIFCDGIAGDAEDWFNDRSEKWQESERGIIAQDWAMAWRDWDSGADRVEYTDHANAVEEFASFQGNWEEFSLDPAEEADTMAMDSLEEIPDAPEY